MATAEQIKSLIKSHFSDDRERFTTISLQLAAHEARQGHASMAYEIRGLVEKGKIHPLRLVRFNRELDDLVICTEPKQRLADLIVAEEMRTRIQRVLREYRQQEKLAKHGMANRRKALLVGPPGTGKTMTASVLAGELALQLHTILMDKLVTKFMGETGAKLRQIFDVIRDQRGVYLFDEFDAIGAERGRDDDVGEMRRVLNAFLQFIDQDESKSLIVAATNNPKLLDQALFRRFDDVLYYRLPTAPQIKKLVENRLGSFRAKRLSLAKATEMAKDLSQADITQACNDAIKAAVLEDRSEVTLDMLSDTLSQRRSAYHGPKS